LSNDDQQKTQAIPSLDDLLKEDRKKRMGGAEPEEEENAAPTEAIDFNALLASGRFPDLEAPAEAPKPPSNPFGASKRPMDDMDDLPPTAPPSPAMMGGMGKPAPASPPKPSMGGPGGGKANMGGPGGNMGGGNMGGGNGGKGSMTPASPPPNEGSKKNLYIALGVAAFFLFCCCPLGVGGGYYGFFMTSAGSTDPIAITGGPEDGNTDNGGANDDGAALNTGAVADMTPDKLEARVKELGWSVIGEPTRINDKSITLPVTKDLTGGAVSLNEFDIGLATDAFVKTMSDNPDAAVARSGDKVVSVIMPGKKADADALLKDILK
jgi:hypothetical protein